MHRFWSATAGLLLTCSAPACEAPAEDSDLARTDSAGVTILESFRPESEEGDGPGELRDFGAASTCGEDTIITSDAYAFNFFDSEGRCRVQLSDYPWLPEHKAFFDKLMADDGENLRVRALPPPGAAPERWTVLSADGCWLGVVRMPEGFALSQVARDRVYGVHRDELGVATARVYRLERSG